MTTYNTGNPIGSSSAKDLYDNAENFDRAVNDRENDFFTDRLGNQRQTLAGIERRGGIQGFATLADLQASPGQKEGQLAQVMNDPSNSGGNHVNGLYRWDGTEWVLTDERYADYESVTLVPTASVRLAPIQAVGDNVVVWTENGKLNAVGLAEKLQHEAVLIITDKVVPLSTVPLLAVGDDVYAWHKPDGIDFSGVSQSLADKVSEKLYITDKVVPLSTDGRSLFRLRAKIASMKNGAGKASILFTGDSWTELPHIPNRLASLFKRQGYDISSDGYVNSKFTQIGDYQSANYSKSGWTFVDGKFESEHPYGSGIDGFINYTTNASATITIDNITGSVFKFFYYSLAGTLRYRVNEGEWTVITRAENTVELQTLIINLSSGANKFELDTVGNSGVINFVGTHICSELSGVEINKCGNGGLRGRQLMEYTQFIAPVADQIDPDLVIIYLGTNDYRDELSTPENYIQALGSLANECKSLSPDVGFIFVAPAKSNATAAIPLNQYRDALYEFCKENGYEFLNLYDQVGDFLYANELGLWNDNLHLSNLGADVNSDILNSAFFKL